MVEACLDKTNTAAGAILTLIPGLGFTGVGPLLVKIDSPVGWLQVFLFVTAFFVTGAYINSYDWVNTNSGVKLETHKNSNALGIATAICNFLIFLVWIAAIIVVWRQVRTCRLFSQ
jgi:hypothetical protein